MKRVLILVAVLALVAAACGGSSDDGDGGSSDATQASSGGGIAAEGELIYSQTCAACHGADATGIDGLGKSLVDSAFVAANDDGEMIAFIKLGRPASHPDNTTGVDMPPKGGNPSLDDQDLADLVAYLRTLQ